MSTSRIEQITNLIDQVREADQYLNSFQEMATKLLDKGLSVELRLAGNEPKTQKVAFNEEGDMVDPDKPHVQGYRISFFEMLESKMTKAPDVEITHKLDQGTTLKILAVLVEEKQKIKNDSFKKLEALGVKIN